MSKAVHPIKEKRINAISVRSNIILLVILTLLAAVCVLPVLLVVIVSFSSEQSIFLKGYSFFPAEFSLEAYRFFLRLGDQIVRSYAITLFVTVFGTLFSLVVTTMLSYVLSRPDYRYGRVLTLLLLFTMLFNGGLVPSYMVNTQLLGLRDTVWALIFPMSLNVFYVVVLRTFFKGIPLEIIEAAHIDGAGEFYTFLRIVLPLSKPGVATIGLFTVIAYWNDWFLGMLYIFETEKYPIQTLLQSMQNSLEALLLRHGCRAALRLCPRKGRRKGSGPGNGNRNHPHPAGSEDPRLSSDRTGDPAGQRRYGAKKCYVKRPVG